MKRRSLFLLFLSATLTLFAAGCGKDQKKESPSAAATNPAGKTAQVIKIGNGGEPQDLDPQAVTGVPEHKILMGLFEGLVTEDPKDLHPIPGLAKSWEVSSDNLVYTFHLRDGLKWSNGDPLTAEDYVASYKRMLTPAFAAEYSYLLWFMVGAEEYNKGTLTDFSKVGVKALDPHTVQLTLKNPTPFLLKMIASHYAWSVVPTKVIAKFGPIDQRRTNWTRAGNLVSNGPFILSEWSPNQKVVLTRNPNYWDAASVKLDRMEFYPTEDIASEERMFRTGQLDITNELPNSKIDVYRKQYPESLHLDPYLGLYFYRLNVTRPPLNDKRVRKALALALDRESIVKNVTRGDQQPAYAVSYPGTDGYSPMARLTGGIAEAKKLLAEVGYPDGKGLPPIELLYNTSENHRAIAEAIQAMWRKNLGIEIKLLNQEWKVYLDSQHSQNYQMQRGGWIADYVDPNVFLEIWITGNGNNDTLWSNADYDKLYQQSLSAKNTEERYAIYQKMDAILVDEVPVIPIYYYTRVNAINPRVKGYYPTLLDNHPYKYIYLEDSK